jgi:hypothetical protein
MSDWWDDLIKGKSKKDQCQISGRLLYVIWNAWKKRNQHIFTGQWLTYIEVASIACEDILQRESVFTAFALVIPAKPD